MKFGQRLAGPAGAVNRRLEGVSGRYLEGCNEADAHEPGIRRGAAATRSTPDNAGRSRKISLDALSGLPSSN
ncbi:MAG TPA: hypothetical protein VFT31_07285 [Kribbella sp.]|nr:hypothetical protein [Kribbella sp.]